MNRHTDFSTNRGAALHQLRQWVPDRSSPWLGYVDVQLQTVSDASDSEFAQVCYLVDSCLGEYVPAEDRGRGIVRFIVMSAEVLEALCALFPNHAEGCKDITVTALSPWRAGPSAVNDGDGDDPNEAEASRGQSLSSNMHNTGRAPTESLGAACGRRPHAAALPHYYGENPASETPTVFHLRQWKLAPGSVIVNVEFEHEAPPMPVSGQELIPLCPSTQEASDDTLILLIRTYAFCDVSIHGQGMQRSFRCAAEHVDLIWDLHQRILMVPHNGTMTNSRLLA